jgi:hypothetical protein
MALRPRIHAFVIAAAMMGCSGSSNVLEPVGVLGVNASIQFLNLEGGCWAIEVANKSYQPLNLPPEFRRDGLLVRVAFRERKDRVSICMIGPIVEILSIERR